MADGFKSGTFNIPVGELTFNVTGLSLSFVPVRVSVGVRSPDADSDFITSAVVGVPNSSGFTVALSSAAPSVGYLLDWTAFSQSVEPTPSQGDSLQVSYNDLFRSVSRFLGYNPSSMTELQTSEVDGYIQSGIRNFYYPPALDGVDVDFEWSFMKMNGTVSLSSGVSSYTLPDGFGRVSGQLLFTDSDARNSVPVIPYGDVYSLLESRDERGRPRFAAVCAKNEFGGRGQRKEILFFPKPDKAYELKIAGDSDSGKLDATSRTYPLGGPMFSELVTESCLAVAEQRANDEIGIHTKNFNTLLVSMIARDRKSAAHNFGRIGLDRIW